MIFNTYLHSDPNLKDQSYNLIVNRSAYQCIILTDIMLVHLIVHSKNNVYFSASDAKSSTPYKSGTGVNFSPKR